MPSSLAALSAAKKAEFVRGGKRGLNARIDLLAKTIKVVVAGSCVDSLPPYAPWPSPPILVPLGPRRRASVLPLTKSGRTVGGFLTSLITGKALFIPHSRREFGVK